MAFFQHFRLFILYSFVHSFYTQGKHTTTKTSTVYILWISSFCFSEDPFQWVCYASNLREL